MKNHITNEPDAVLMRGGSMIVDPLGRIVAGPDFSKQTILVAELENRRSRARQVRLSTWWGTMPAPTCSA